MIILLRYGKSFQRSRKQLLLLLVLFFIHLPGAEASELADSIINQAYRKREIYSQLVREYTAEVYIKGVTDVKKKNLLYRLAPDFLYWDRKGEDSFAEALLEIKYTAPNYFKQTIKAINGSSLYRSDIQKRVAQFLDVNIYSPTIFNNQVIMPGVKDAHKYYNFNYVTTLDTLEMFLHQIEIVPKIKSQKLIEGFLFITDQSWEIRAFDLRGKWDFSTFRIQTVYDLYDGFLPMPQQSMITFDTDLLGNSVENSYVSSYKYLSVDPYVQRPHRTNKYDLSEYFDIQSQTVPIMRDSLFWQLHRPMNITAHEDSLFRLSLKAQEARDSLVISKSTPWDYALNLISSQRFEYNDNQFSYSGLVNPSKLAYSKLDGISYWQEIRWRKRFASGMELQFSPNAGYLFQRRELYFGTPLRWLFKPKKMGEANFAFGNKSRSYNSTFIEQIKEQIPDSINFEDLNLEYFKHYYVQLHGRYELTNGLLMTIGVNNDWYLPVKSKGSVSLRSTNERVDDDVVDIINNNYSSFTPYVNLVWTPGQYYRFNGKRKQYIGSRFPTFSFEYARGIKGIIRSNSDYERLEADIQQKIPLGLMRSLQYYVGAGYFSNVNSVYFADFRNFRRLNIPRSWHDPIGGVFHLLPGHWYNAGNRYLQAHLMYESPFMLMRFFPRLSQDIVKERFYLSQLYMPIKPCYTEIGYGVGNGYLNAGIFVSLNRGRYESLGAKVVFELGN